jgi:hypothetical protein
MVATSSGFIESGPEKEKASSTAEAEEAWNHVALCRVQAKAVASSDVPQYHHAAKDTTGAAAKARVTREAATGGTRLAMRMADDTRRRSAVSTRSAISP